MSRHDRDFAPPPRSESDGHLATSMIGIVRGNDLHLDRCAAGLVAAEGTISIRNGGCGAVATTGDVSIRYGGCGPMITSGDVSIENGGTQVILTAGRVTIGRRAFAGLVMSPKVTVEPGGRVLMSGPLALAVSAAAGIAVALLSRFVRR